MIYKYNEKIDVKDICDLRQSVGWNRMEKEMAEPPRREGGGQATKRSDLLGSAGGDFPLLPN